MKILLVNPPAEHIIRESLPPVVEDSTGFYPPLGLLYVAAHAEAIDDCQVKVFDCQAEGIGYRELSSKITSYGPDVVGIQVMTFTLIDALQVARTARDAVPDALIVAGGPHPTIFPEETVLLPEIDVAVQGEGEYTFETLLKALKSGRAIENVPGLITKNSIAVGDSLARLNYIKNLDQLRMPARHLLDVSLYSSPLSSHRLVTTMMSSRGCPGKCIFCDRPQMGKILRKRSPDKVVREMVYCVRELGIGEIIFYDDTFNIDKKWVLAICERILSSRLKVRWGIRARIDTMTPEMIRQLRRAGCTRISYGVETGNPRLQKVIRKNLDLDQVRKVFTLTKREGIETLGYFMIGLPTEKKEEIDKTVDLILSLPMDYAHIALFTPYPGTAIYHQALKEGYYGHDYWREFARNPEPDFTPRYWNEYLSDPELLRILKHAYFQFYRRPGYIMQRIAKVRSANELFQKATLGLKLLKEVAFSK